MVSVNYKGLVNDLSIGDRILVNNGLVIFEVRDKTDCDVICTVVTGGVLSDRKSMSFPNKVLNQVYLSEQDKADLLFGIENSVDYVAASFVSRKQDLVDLKAFLKENGGESIASFFSLYRQKYDILKLRSTLKALVSQKSGVSSTQ